jgi:hypothetical protein
MPAFLSDSIVRGLGRDFQKTPFSETSAVGDEAAGRSIAISDPGLPLSRPSETSGKPADEGRNPEARSLAVSHRHRVPGYRYVQPNINFAMLVHGSSPALRKGPPHASNLADLAVWDEPPSSARTCGHTVKLRSLWYLGVFWAPAVQPS